MTIEAPRPRPTYTRSGRHTLDEAGIALLDLDEGALERRLLEVFSSPEYRPPVLPAVALQLMDLSRRPDTGADEVVRLLESDPMLAAHTLRLCRSAFYRTREPVHSLKQAVVSLGLSTLRDLVLQAALEQRLFRAPVYSDVLARLARHSQGTAVAARILCRYTALADEYAFLCGLLHDVGLAALLIALGEGALGEAPVDSEALWPALDRVHGHASARLGALWELPEDIQRVIGHHHQPRIEGMVHPLAAAVCLAEHEALEAGWVVLDGGAPGPGGLFGAGFDRSGAEARALAAEALGLDESRLALVRAEIHAALEAI